ncbi:hypothetical protein DL766_000992 [Monosporascus sp. MC13-8B]|nr:hypothetical protein DL763_004601 [Monosporascus cannonballus]RYP38414.1 hypothetical protein DL766_000992 [Monosporascus sp. MC13-8B]
MTAHVIPANWTTAFTPSSMLLVGAVLAIVYAVYRRALPKPIPGIPYVEESAKRLFGDLPRIAELQKVGRKPADLYIETARLTKSPISQVFFLPFKRPMVIVSDFREAQDLVTARCKDLERGAFNNETFGGVTPEHFISMNTSDPRFKVTRALTNDLMTPRFINEVSAPEIYSKMRHFVDLWRLKAQAADGRAFKAYEDLNFLSYDIITAAALGIDDSESETVQHLRSLHSDFHPRSPSEVPTEAEFGFPDFAPSDLMESLLTLAEAVGNSFTKPSPRLFHALNNLRPAMRKAWSDRKRILQQHIDNATARLNREGDNFKSTAALDYMVAREISSAKKEGRRPDLTSRRLHDILFVYLAAGQDTTHSVMTFLVKQLGAQPKAQSKLRQSLRDAYPSAAAECRQPMLSEILQAHVPYLEAFIEEVLRLNTPIAGVSQQTVRDITVLGHVIPRGTSLLFLNEGPSFHGPMHPVAEESRSESSQKHADATLGEWVDGAEFRPERWLRKPRGDGEEGNMVFDPKAGPFMTFSLGPRMCWGRRLAYLELRLVVTLLVWNFEFLPIPPKLDNWNTYDLLIHKPCSCLVRLRNALEA